MKREVLPVLINSPNFEIRKAKAGTNSRSEQIDFLEFKRIVLQNLVRGLYQTAVKHGIVDIIDDELPLQNQSSNRIVKTNEMLKTLRQKKYRNRSLSRNAQNDLNDIKKKISNLFKRAVAKEVRKETNLKELEQERYSRERKSTFQISGSVVYILVTGISFALAVMAAFFNITLPGVPDELNEIIPVLIGVIPPLITVSWQINKTATQRNEAEKDASIYYLYDYDISTLQSELEQTLFKLLNNNYKKYKVIFVIDELDKMDETEIIEVIKSLKSLLNQGSSLFVLITGEEFFNTIMERSNDRGKEYTLFSQKIFLQRPEFEEMMQFMDHIIDTDETKRNRNGNFFPAIKHLFTWEKIPRRRLKSLERLSADGILSSDLDDEDVFELEERAQNVEDEELYELMGMAQIVKEDEGRAIRISLEDKSILLKKEGKQTHASMIIPYDNMTKRRIYEFGVMEMKNNKNEKELSIYTRSEEYRVFQYYACYASKCDFFDLYNVLRDNMPSFTKEGLPRLDIKLEQDQIIKAGLQEVMATVYTLNAYVQPSDWHRNDALLELTYDLIIKLAERNPDTLRILVDRRSPFTITLLDDGNSVVDEVPSRRIKKYGADWLSSEDDKLAISEVEKVTLLHLIKTLEEKQFLKIVQSDGNTDLYEITGKLEEASSTLKALSEWEIAFQNEYKIFRYVIFDYANLYMVHSGDRFSKILFDYRNLAQNMDAIIDNPKMIQIISSELSSYKESFNKVFAGLTQHVEEKYGREEVEGLTKVLREARLESLRNFTVLIEEILKQGSSDVIVTRLSTEDLKEKFGMQFGLPAEETPPETSKQLTITIPSLLIESVPEKVERRQLLVVQNMATKSRISNFEKIQKSNPNLHVFDFTINTSITDDIIEKFELPVAQSNITKDTLKGNAQGASRIMLEFPTANNSIGDAVDMIISWVDEVKLLEDKDAVAWIEEGKEALIKANYKLAIQSFKRATTADPKSNVAWYNTALAFFETNRFEEAIANYDKALEFDENDLDALYGKGLSLSQLNNDDQSLEVFDRVLALNPNYEWALYAKGLILSKQGKYDAAITCFDKALQLDPKYVGAWVSNAKGLILSKQGKYDAAITCFDKALETIKFQQYDPYVETFWYNKALALFHQPNYNEAIKCFDKVLEKNPRYAEAWYHKGIILHNLQQYKQAIVCFDKSIRLTSNYADAWYGRARSKAMIQNIRGGVADLKQAIEIAGPHGGELYREQALKDESFTNLKADPSFKYLVDLEQSLIFESAPGTGYDVDFLSVRIDFPQLTATNKQTAFIRDGSEVINYTHFSLALNKHRRLAFWVGWNVDGGSIKKISRKGISFALDPAIPREFQIGEEIYAANRLDRGHIARRGDVVWGPLEDAGRANRDTFFYTNVIPRVRLQGSKGGLWWRLAEAALEKSNIESRRASLFGGPIFLDNDPEFRGVKLPREFWKVIVFVEGHKLKSKSFILVQDLSKLEAGELDRFEVFQVALSEIEERCGLIFPSALKAADLLEVDLDRRQKGNARRMPLSSLEDIDWS